jgi:hypothetical protein
LSLPNLVCIENPYRCKKCQRRITARPRISTQARGLGCHSEPRSGRTQSQQLLSAGEVAWASVIAKGRRPRRTIPAPAGALSGHSVIEGPSGYIEHAYL